VWERLREYAATQGGTFTSQEVIGWFARHYPGTNDTTLRTHIRNASYNVGDRSWASGREPFLTRLDRGLFRRATDDEVAAWRRGHLAGTAADGADRRAPITDTAPSHPTTTERESAHDVPGVEWHTEANTQHLLVEWLKRDGWEIVRTANTAAREHGVDVVAKRGDERLGVEVKGYPSRYYVNGPKKGLVKTTTPPEQAPKWFAHALVPAMKLRTADPDSRSIMCFPDFPVYRRLHAETASSLRAARIEVWLIAEHGAVEVLN
jgi:hypothetical protein